MHLERQYIFSSMMDNVLDIKYAFHTIEDFVTNEAILQKITSDNSSVINFYWLGKRDYNPVWDLQKEIHKLKTKNIIGDVVLLLEHNHVYTLGKNANENHILSSNYENIEIVKIDRGGDVTYHGPGQLIGYPIIDLHNYKMSINWYLDLISKSIIDMLDKYNIKSQYRSDYVGIWVEDSKIAAIGVRLSKWITMHGFALNINTDLSYYSGLIPCGIFECGVTSMHNEKKINYSVKNLAKAYSDYFIKHLNEEV